MIKRNNAFHLVHFIVTLVALYIATIAGVKVNHFEDQRQNIRELAAHNDREDTAIFILTDAITDLQVLELRRQLNPRPLPPLPIPRPTPGQMNKLNFNERTISYVRRTSSSHPVPGARRASRRYQPGRRGT